MEKKKLLYFLTVFIGFFLPLSTYASQDVNTVISWVDKNPEQMEAYLTEAREFKEGLDATVLKFMKEVDTKVQGCQNKVPFQEKESHRNHLLIFVSLSMPKKSLKNLYREAEQQSLPLILRGLKNNSFKETIDALKELEIAVQIDPNLFEEYQVKTVPTFIAIHQKEPLQIQGNVSLSYAQKKLEEVL